MQLATLAVNKSDYIRGNPEASVTLLEYGDFECPFCGEAYPIVKELLKDMGDDIRFVFRNFPLSQHPHSFAAACAADAAGLQEAFWDMHDLLFENQDALSDTDLVSYANALDLDIERFVQDMTSEPIRERVKAEFWSGVSNGVNATPTFFVNGKRHNGTYAYDELRAAVEWHVRQRSGV